MTKPEPPEILRRIGGRVRRLRQELDLSMRELAARADLSPRFLSDVESGAGNIAVGRLARIGDALGVPLTELVRPPRGDSVREEIDALLDGRSDEELASVRRTLEILLGRRRRHVIALLGIRGAGKSSVGAKVAAELGVPFVELDERIEAAAGMAAADIFAFHGESHYRELEARCLAALVAEHRPCVVALPGGVVGNDEALTLLRSACRTVWLQAKAEEYWTRVFEQGDTRPIEGHEDAMDDLRRMIKQREPLYRQSDLVVQTSGRSVDEVTERVLASLRRSRIAGESNAEARSSS